MTIATATKVALQLATGNYGYGQDDRKSAWSDNGKLGLDGLAKVGDTDCSFSVALIFYLAGLIDRSILMGTIYTGNIAQVLGRTGMFDLIDVRRLTLSQIRAKVREGDGLLGVGHIVYGLGGGQCVSFESTEKGTSTGGRLGDQTGREGRIRGIYLRGPSSRRAGRSVTGWTIIIRPKSPASLLGALIAAYGAGKSGAAEAAQIRLSRRAPFDGPRYADFMAEWAELDKGAPITYNAAEFAAAPGHAFILLGGTRPQMRLRMTAGLPAILANPGSKVIVSGAPVRGTTTEAQYMQAWLVANGVEPDRIIVEGQAGSTIGNALYSARILIDQGLTSYTIVSHASHLRRAAVMFRAALAKADASSNTRRQVAATTSIGFDDYGDRSPSAALPVTAATRSLIASHVAALLGVTAQYQAAK